MMKKILLIIISSASIATYADEIQWHDFENNAYIGAAYSGNTASLQSFGNNSSSSMATNLGLTALFDSNLWLNLQLTSNFLQNKQFVSNWLFGTTKIGYSFQKQNFNIVPYAMIGFGDNGAYYTSTPNFSYGFGLLSEYGITSNLLIYADVNYQWQNYGSGINQDFSSNVLTNVAQYNLTGTPYTYGVELGGKYITNGGYYINPFVKYNDYQQQFSSGIGNASYGTLTPETSQFQIGLNFGLLI